MRELKDSLWSQFGASIDMLKQAIERWPDEKWETRKEFFYMVYHSLVFLDYYLSIDPKGFTSKWAFTIVPPGEIEEGMLDDIRPNRSYLKQEMLEYLEENRRKCKQVIDGLTEATIADRWIEQDGDMNYSRLEILLYNMRHVQHHTAQLNKLLKNEITDVPRWIGRAADSL